jgi:vancomycin permeability regulator SanA
MIHEAKHHAKKYKWWLLGAAVVFALLLWGPTVYAKLSTSPGRHDLSVTPAARIPHKHVAIVFGAGLYDGDKPTSYLRERVTTAVDLYKAKRVDKLLMTGDNSVMSYNEPAAMLKLAIKLGVPKDDVTLDYAGRNTYDSCYRARHIFKVSQATLVTQGYHLPRAMMTCRGLGMDVIGVAAEHESRDYTVGYIIREWLSTDKAAYQIIAKPNPTIGGPALPIR